MMRILVDVAVEPEVLAGIEALPGVEVRRIGPEERVRYVEPELLHDADVLFGMYPPENFGDLRQLRWLQLAASGYNHVLALDLPGRGIRLTNARGCFDVPIAEWNLAMMVNLARNVRRMIRNQEAAVWDRSAEFQNEIRGRTVGIWGYGGIGRETARLARAFGMRVHVLSRRGVGPADGVWAVPGTGDPDGTLPHRVFLAGEKMEFLAGLDYLILTTPLTPSTAGMVGEAELRALPPTACLLNPARGPLVEEQALLRALREGWIAGAALDTHYHYPMPPEHALWSLPQVILTPHISGSSLNPNYRARTWEIFRLNLSRYLAGEPLLNEIPADQLRGGENQ